MITCFEDAICWKKSKELTLQIYTLFDSNNDYGFRDQIQRASVSIMNNIAEGFERKTSKEFIHFLHIAKGSCGEVRSMLHIAKELGYLTNSDAENVQELATEISKIISGLIKSIHQNTS